MNDRTFRQKNLYRSPFLLDIVKVAGGTAIGQVITALSYPILSRLYPPEVFATFALFLSISNLFTVVICLRYEVAIVLAENETLASNLLAISLTASLILPIFIGLAIMVNTQLITSYLRAPEIGSFLWLTPVYLVIFGINQSLLYWAIRNKAFQLMAAAKISTAAVEAVLFIGLGILANGARYGLVVGLICGAAASALVLFGGQMRLKLLQNIQHRLQWERAVEALERYRKFPLIDIWGTWLSSLSWQIPPLLLSVFFTQQAVGSYSMAFTLIQLPVGLVGTAIAQVFLQQISMNQTDPERLARISGQVYSRLVALGMLPAAVLSLAGKDLLVVILGAQWEQAGIFVQIFSIWMFFWLLASPLGAITNALEKQEVNFFVQGLLLVGRVAALWFGGCSGDIFLTLILFSSASALVYAWFSVYSLRLAQVPVGQIGKVFTQYLMITGLVFGGLFVFQRVIHPEPLIFLATCGFTGLSYGIFLLRYEFQII